MSCSVFSVTHATRAHACMQACNAYKVCTSAQPQRQRNQLRDPATHLQTDTPHHSDEQHTSTSPTYMHNNTVQTGDTIPLKHSALTDGALVAPACVASAQIRHPIFTFKNRRPAPSIYQWFCGRRPRRKIGLMPCVLPRRLLAARIHRRAASLPRSVHVADLATMSPRSAHKHNRVHHRVVSV